MPAQMANAGRRVPASMQVPRYRRAHNGNVTDPGPPRTAAAQRTRRGAARFLASSAARAPADAASATAAARPATISSAPASAGPRSAKTTAASSTTAAPTVYSRPARPARPADGPPGALTRPAVPNVRRPLCGSQILHALAGLCPVHQVVSQPRCPGQLPPLQHVLRQGRQVVRVKLQGPRLSTTSGASSSSAPPTTTSPSTPTPKPACRRSSARSRTTASAGSWSCTATPS